MTSDLGNRIDVYLLTQQRWVSAEELCRVFDIKERELRARGEVPGLCTDFAISGDQGFLHVRCATDEQFDHAVARLFAHGTAELQRVEKLKLARTTATTGLPLVEKFTGQTVMRL